MNQFKETKLIRTNLNDLYNLVLDVEKYHEFLPWIDRVVVIERDDSQMRADMYVTFSGIKQNYSSEVSYNLDNDNAIIEVKALKGIFNHLYNKWSFTREGNDTRIIFEIEFEFSSKFLDNVAAPLFEVISKKMISAFEKRALELYDHKQNP